MRYGWPSSSKSDAPMARRDWAVTGIRSGGSGRFRWGYLSSEGDARGRPSAPGRPRRSRWLLADREALLVAVVDELALPSGEPLVQVDLVRVRLPDGVAEDAVRVHLVRQVRPARRHVLRGLREHLVDLLAAE